MPIYEYKCENCGHICEHFQNTNAVGFIVCDECGKPALKKIISQSSFRLKGDGWYETDFKQKGNNHDR